MVLFAIFFAYTALRACGYPAPRWRVVPAHDETTEDAEAGDLSTSAVLPESSRRRCSGPSGAVLCPMADFAHAGSSASYSWRACTTTAAAGDVGWSPAKTV